VICFYEEFAPESIQVHLAQTLELNNGLEMKEFAGYFVKGRRDIH